LIGLEAYFVHILAIHVKIAPMIHVFGISNCDTVKKARAWLTDQGVAYSFHDFKKQGVPLERLTAWANAVGWDKLLNRQGTTWRKLDAAAQASAQTVAGATALVVTNPSVIKRPVVEWGAGALDNAVTVGFDALGWAECLEIRAKPPKIVTPL
jgi:arsenate reductase (glutaredoxin)